MFRVQKQGPKHIIGKVLKRRYRKWPRIGHLDICSPSYGQKKGRESNWQFDSRPLKVGNRPFSDIRFECARWRWKDLNKGYNFGSDLVTSPSRGESCVSKCPWLVPTPKGVPNAKLTSRGLFLDVDSHKLS